MADLSSLFEIQAVAHNLIKMLTGFDTQQLVGEKSEDARELKEATAAVSDFFAHLEQALSDGIYDRQEFEASKLKLQKIEKEWAEALAEIKDQRPDNPTV